MEVPLRVRLTKKLAPVLNGVDLKDVCVGDCVELPPASARMLLAEGWAQLPDTPSERSTPFTEEV
jgi:hypothetical protein